MYLLLHFSRVPGGKRRGPGRDNRARRNYHLHALLLRRPHPATLQVGETKLRSVLKALLGCRKHEGFPLSVVFGNVHGRVGGRRDGRVAARTPP